MHSPAKLKRLVRVCSEWAQHLQSRLAVQRLEQVHAFKHLGADCKADALTHQQPTSRAKKGLDGSDRTCRRPLHRCEGCATRLGRLVALAPVDGTLRLAQTVMPVDEEELHKQSGLAVRAALGVPRGPSRRRDLAFFGLDPAYRTARRTLRLIEPTATHASEHLRAAM